MRRELLSIVIYTFPPPPVLSSPPLTNSMTVCTEKLLTPPINIEVTRAGGCVRVAVNRFLSVNYICPYTAKDDPPDMVGRSRGKLYHKIKLNWHTASGGE